jgi:putative transposase
MFMFCVGRRRTVIHNWIQKVDQQPSDDVSSNRVVGGETPIQIDSDIFWLYAAVDLCTNNYSILSFFRPKNNSSSFFSAI